MVGITFHDMYDGYSEILVDGDPNELYGVIEDFFEIAGEAISDDLASSAVRKFRTFASRLGYPVSPANGRPVGMNMSVDLPSAGISGVQPDAVDLSTSGVMDEMRAASEPSVFGMDDIRAASEPSVFGMSDMIGGDDLKAIAGIDGVDDIIGVPNDIEEESNAYW